MNLNFYKNKKVFITGHTGFKGSWLCKILLMAGAEITGYSLLESQHNRLFQSMELNQAVRSYFHDIRDLKMLKKGF